LIPARGLLLPVASGRVAEDKGLGFQVELQGGCSLIQPGGDVIKFVITN